MGKKDNKKCVRVPSHPIIKLTSSPATLDFLNRSKVIWHLDHCSLVAREDDVILHDHPLYHPLQDGARRIDQLKISFCLQTNDLVSVGDQVWRTTWPEGPRPKFLK